MRLLVIGAHAMDAELLGGALAARIVLNHGRAKMLHLTRGERGYAGVSVGDAAGALELEMAEASRLLRVPFDWPGLQAPLSDIDRDELLPILTSYMRDLAPNLVISHWEGSWHPSHVHASRVVRDAVSTLREEGYGIGLLYGENCEDLNGFLPHAYAAIPQSAYALWHKAVRAYRLFRRSEPPAHPDSTIPYFSYYEAAFRVRGHYVSMPMATALMLGPWRLEPRLYDQFQWLDTSPAR